ncbi:MAG: DUF4105 domain-containing protein [Betaproteobacteria bacterium]|nr:DUF4105 domain-containing protein [Betaproteobacteria bacterium]
MSSVPAFAADDAYLAELVARSRQSALAARIEWHNLLHYKPNWVSPGLRSLADDEGFFNSPRGKSHPQDELEATLASFFSTTQESETAQNPQCRFAARYHWLKGELGFDAARLPEQTCPRLNAWREALNPAGITLIFASAYLNNPASMFGHTLLRIDAKDQDEKTRLLAYAVNYAANTDETSGLVFAVRGLFGGYAGGFAIGPYYLKVREYSNLENRDLWEYRLDFSPAEIDQMIRHLWELGPTRFDYYFFDENCSYHLLSVFEVARPGLALTDRFRWSAIPSETVRAVTEQAGLLKEVVYRPAAATVLRRQLAGIPHAQYPLLRELAEGDARADDARLAGLAPGDRAAIVESAHGYASYRQNAAHDASAETAARLRELLRARSRLPASDAVAVATPDARPDEGHRSARADLALGREAGANYRQLRLRPAYHDLLDPEAGYNRGSQIEFFSLSLRDDGTRGARLQELRPLEILSLTPRDEFFRSLSWRFNAGWVREPLADGSAPLMRRVHGGVGLSWGAGTSIATVMMEATADLSASLERGYAAGAGPAIGWMVDPSPLWRARLTARHLRYAWGQQHNASEIALVQRYTLGREHALRLEFARRAALAGARNDAQLSWMIYF